MRSPVPPVLGILILASVSLHAQLPHFRAKVVLEDGTPPPAETVIVADSGQRLAPDCLIFNRFGNGGIEYAVNPNARTSQTERLARMEGTLNQADVCAVRITVKGYRQTDAVLHDGAVIVLKRLGDNDGSATSFTEAKAPADARKAYEKGEAAMARKKWAEAQKNLEQAVEIYPEYAPALADLGEVLLQEQNPRDALPALEKARKADPKYLKPYLELSRLYIGEGRMQDALDTANHGIALNPVEFPGIFFYHAVASYNLHRFDEAEKSARRAIELDSAHQIPVAEQLLASVLAAKRDRQGAAEHLRKYLAMSPNASDAPEVRRQIADLEQSAH